MAAQQLLFLELNEINIEFVEHYVAQGHLPAFKAFIEKYGYSRTSSEKRYEHLEPWIQWVTAHTGLDYGEHGIFRLGDIVDHDLPQIWEKIEDLGLTVGAVSPMNAKLRAKRPAFFIPDPWTPTEVAAPSHYRKLYRAVAQAVNDNAEGKLSMASLLDLVVGAASAARWENYPRYLALVAKARHRPWARALFLDLLLADLFMQLVDRSKVNFASLFLNAGAHIQHHYMFSSSAYSGECRNPDWYIRQGLDPLLEVYALYDRILASMQKRFPDARIMFATGLHQAPYPTVSYYWRLKDHGSFLDKIGVPHASAEPRMSRDFLVCCESAEQAESAERRLRAVVVEDGEALFDVDNRGDSLFVTLTYPRDISPTAQIRIANETFDGLRDDVAFVAIKNGEHDGIGYFGDSGRTAKLGGEDFPLREVPARISEAFSLV